ncbi:Magnesium transporter mgtE [Pantoea agglomerans]|uniref:Magnesium transporter mgtE n=1 Tax=Enterobacter agglomerans TaxID=549 RepID=A0A379ADC7_ENTAG|nr:Magnesium transporter mgtE [Pantoea agglomerans]
MCSRRCVNRYVNAGPGWRLTSAPPLSPPRVIGLFEGTISQIVALATLMPIVAGIGGNTGNQTITMIVRALALHQVEPGNFSFLIVRELGVALINGLFWGGIMGGITWMMYDNMALGGVMMLAMALNLLLAALMGVLVPLVMTKMNRDPAVGSSVLITALNRHRRLLYFPGAGDNLPAAALIVRLAGRNVAATR